MLSAFVLRAGVRFGLAGLLLLGVNDALQNAVAEGDTRTLSFHHLHTNEDITVTFKRNGRYDDAALKRLDWFMRDWRKDEQVQMDPHLFDVLWEAYREVGGAAPIQVVCGYRSPATNSMLRARSSGVAEVSQHTAGHAMDFFIPGVSLEKLREVGLRLQRGGVGFYPSSGSPFVHMDTGSIRHWPRMTYAQLSKVFPDGRTVHIPSDGQPLPGYALALADVEARGNAPSAISLAAARDAGVDVSAAGKSQKSLFARIFGGGKDTEEASDEAAAPAPAPKRARTTQVASLAAPKPVATQTIVPLPAARPQALAAAKPDDRIVTAALAAKSADKPNVFDQRGAWLNPVETGDDLPALAEPASPFQVADAGSEQTPLSYAAADATPAPAARAKPMGKTMPQLAREAAATPATTAAMTAPPMSFGGQRADSPWLRATLLAPAVNAMKVTQMGASDPRPLTDLIYKPSMSLTMTFSADPASGMVAERFSGSAVVFMATTSFTGSAKTASLR